MGAFDWLFEGHNTSTNPFLGPMDRSQSVAEREIGSARIDPDLLEIPDYEPESQKAFQDYSAWAGRMPTREQFKPSGMDRLGAAFLGFTQGFNGNPTAGFLTAQEQLDRPFNQAMQDWAAEGKGLGDVGRLGQQYEASRRIARGDDLRYAGQQLKHQGTMAGIAEKHAANNQRYQYEMANAKNDADKNVATARYQDEKNRIDNEELSIKRYNAQSGRMEAEAAGTQAEAYSRGVDARGGPKPVPIDKQFEVEDRVLEEVIAGRPEYRDLFERDEKGRLKPVVGMKESNRALFLQVMDEVRRKAQERSRSVYPINDPNDFPLNPPPIRSRR